MTGPEFAPPGPPRQPASSPSGAAPHGSIPGPRQPGQGRTKKAPRWALWVTVVAGVAIALGIVWAVMLTVLDGLQGPAQAGDTGTMHSTRVIEGMCLVTIGDDGAVGNVTVVNCDDSHRAEVVAVEDLRIEVYPGQKELQREAELACKPRIPISLPDDASWTTWIPSEDSWQRGDRTVTCLAVSGSPITGSYVDTTSETETTQTQNA